MVDLNKLNRMLDNALDSETAESLNSWIDEHIVEDRAQGIICDSELGILNMYEINSDVSSLDKATVHLGMSENVSYNKVIISDLYDSSSFDKINLAV